MILEVRGANTRNKGAELMLRAIVAELGADAAIAADHGTGTYAERAQLGLLQKVSLRRIDSALATAAGAIPGRARALLRDRYGLVVERDVDAVLDASGFAYSDQFELERSRAAAGRFRLARRHGARVVLLPQALGPFRDPARRAAFLDIVEHSDVVYAREQVSLDHALAAGAPPDRVRLAPDFTCLLPGELPPGFEKAERLALVVPSAKLLTETGPDVRDAYLPFLAAGVAALREEGLDVRLLVHERGDGATVHALQDLLEAPAPVVREESAVHLKGIIGAADVVLGSRFHALVSALSQGVPALGVGWSHKYEMLFADYGCADRVVPVSLGAGEVRGHVRELASGSQREELTRRAADEQERASEMWRQVRGLLGLDRPAGPGRPGVEHSLKADNSR